MYIKMTQKFDKIKQFILNATYCQSYMILTLIITIIPISVSYLSVLRKIMLIWILILLSKDILVDRSLVKNKCGVLMLLFALMSGVTILLNYKFEFIKNISF